MALPEQFSEFEHLQSTYFRVHNRLVREEFSDVGGDDWSADIGTPRGSLRHACTIKDSDTDGMVQMRTNLLFFHLRKARDFHHPVYGIPIGTFQEQRKFRPQIFLYFKEDEEDVDPDYQPVRGRITFRLMDEDSGSLSKSELTTLANKIKTEFGTANGYLWKKGKDLATYKDVGKGYDFQLLVRSKTDGKELIGKLLDLQTHTPNWKYLSYKESDDPTSAFPTIPGTEVILGKTQKKARRRPIATVRFQYALCHLHGAPEPIVLYDRSFSFGSSLAE